MCGGGVAVRPRGTVCRLRGGGGSDLRQAWAKLGHAHAVPNCQSVHPLPRTALQTYLDQLRPAEQLGGFGKYTCWALLAVNTFLAPTASLAMHASGIVAGLTIDYVAPLGEWHCAVIAAGSLSVHACQVKICRSSPLPHTKGRPHCRSSTQ